MSGHYSPKQFFRKVSNKFLIDYLEQKGIDFDIDLYSIYDHEVDIIFNAFIKLDEKTRHAMESDFQRIHALASDGGIVALTDEARENLITLIFWKPYIQYAVYITKQYGLI